MYKKVTQIVKKTKTEKDNIVGRPKKEKGAVTRTFRVTLDEKSLDKFVEITKPKSKGGLGLKQSDILAALIKNFIAQKDKESLLQEP